MCKVIWTVGTKKSKQDCRLVEQPLHKKISPYFDKWKTYWALSLSRTSQSFWSVLFTWLSGFERNTRIIDKWKWKCRWLWWRIWRLFYLFILRTRVGASRELGASKHVFIRLLSFSKWVAYNVYSIQIILKGFLSNFQTVPFLYSSNKIMMDVKF